MTRLSLPPLYAIVDPLDTGRTPVELAGALLAGGLQAELQQARAGALLLINDRPDVARAAGADGVHLGQDDLPVAAARAVLGPGAVIGVSTHDVEQARAAAGAGADYLSAGPVNPTPTKPGLSLIHI